MQYGNEYEYEFDDDDDINDRDFEAQSINYMLSKNTLNNTEAQHIRNMQLKHEPLDLQRISEL